MATYSLCYSPVYEEAFPFIPQKIMDYHKKIKIKNSMNMQYKWGWECG
jgi:hypothetical protein